MKIGTHNGTFHCDEVLACCMLKLLPQYKNAEIIRTRDPVALGECDIVVDVGGVYDPSKHRYDHHQRGFTESMNSLDSKYPWVTKLSSAGLVYFHFGHQVISEQLSTQSEDDITKIVYSKIYEGFIEEIDGIDNGIASCNEPKYRINTNLSSRISHINPAWNEKNIDIDSKFLKAISVVQVEFLDRINYFKNSWLPARQFVVDALEKRYEIDSSGEIVCFPSGGLPWKDHLLTLETDLNISPTIKFVLFADESSKWRVQCVPVESGSFENRLGLLEDWRGLRDDELSKKSGIEGCIFVHMSGFIGGNIKYDGALQMAKLTLKNDC